MIILLSPLTLRLFLYERLQINYCALFGLKGLPGPTEGQFFNLEVPSMHGFVI